MYNGVKLPRIITHNHSGMWIGYVLGWSITFPRGLLFEGRRILAWRGGRLDTSQIATQGIRAADLLGDWVEVEIPYDDSLCDVITTTEAIVETARAHPVWVPTPTRDGSGDGSGGGPLRA